MHITETADVTRLFYAELHSFEVLLLKFIK